MTTIDSKSGFFRRIVGKDALGETISDLLGQNEVGESSELVLVFDMDKTLTNAKDPTHVRGGNRTLEALQKAKDNGAKLFIISAANPTKIAVDSAVNQLSTGTYSKLKDMFQMQVDTGTVLKHKGVDLAMNGTVYMSGYNKEEALDHIVEILTKAPSKKHRFAFFDDAVGNAFYIGSYFQKKNLIATSFWWDPFEEDCFLTNDLPDFDETTKYEEHRNEEWDKKIKGLEYAPPTHINLTSSDFSYGTTNSSLIKKSELSAFGVDIGDAERRGRCYKQVAAYRWGPNDPKKTEVDAEAKKKERLALLDHSKNTKAAKSFLMNNLPMGPPSKRS